MDERKKKRNDAIDKINTQITRIEQIIEALLKDLDIEKMTAFERLTMVYRFLGQHQRAIEMQQTCAIDAPEKRESILIGALMRQMRGDTEVIEAEDIDG